MDQMLPGFETSESKEPEKVFSVKEFNEFIGHYLKSVGEVVVEGEISEFNKNGSFLFMKIKEDDTSVDVFALSYKISGINTLEVGMVVKVYGIPGLYQKRGSFSIQAEQIIPSGEGNLKLAYDKLKLMLQTEGLFDSEHKREIKKFPQKIGLITAKNSQAYADFVKVLSERFGGIKIYFYPANVQGKNSVKSIVRGIEYFNQNYLDLDALVLVRGGGAMEDLISFNDEIMVRELFASKIPTVVGVGHEKDHSLVDYVADLRASTPSNAAELLVMSRTEAKTEIDNLIDSSKYEFESLLEGNSQRIDDSLNIMNLYLSEKTSILKDRILMFSKAFSRFISDVETLRTQSGVYNKNLYRAVTSWLNYFKKDFDSVYRLLKNLDYRQTLKRGFSITKSKDGKIIQSINNLKIGEEITTIVSDGTINSKSLSYESKIDV